MKAAISGGSGADATVLKKNKGSVCGPNVMAASLQEALPVVERPPDLRPPDLSVLESAVGQAPWPPKFKGQQPL